MRSTKPKADIALVKALFAEMRASHVFVFRGLGLSIQMSNTAWDLARPEQPQPHGETDVALEDMPPELSGPYMAFRKRAMTTEDQVKLANAAEVARIKKLRRKNPTNPDLPIDDAAEQGDDLPNED